MKILPDPISFEWDRGNESKNFIKHGVTKEEAERVFVDKSNLIGENPKHSQIEERQQIFGVTNEQRKLIVIFTIRRDKIRIISARDMNKKERRFYEEKIKVNTQV